MQVLRLTAGTAVSAVSTVLAESFSVEESVLGGADGLPTVLAPSVARGLAGILADVVANSSGHRLGRGQGEGDGQSRREKQQRPHGCCLQMRYCRTGEHLCGKMRDGRGGRVG